jgi:hypothetical protein
MDICPLSLLSSSGGTERYSPTGELSHIEQQAQGENKAVVNSRAEPPRLCESDAKPLMANGQLCLPVEQICKCLPDIREYPMYPKRSKSLCQSESASNEFASLNSLTFGNANNRKSGQAHLCRNVDPFVSGSAPCLVRFLKHHAEPVSIRSSAVCRYESFSGKFLLWLGPVLLQRWSLEYGRPVFQVTRPDQGYGVAFTVAFSFGKANLFLYWLRNSWTLQSLSVALRWKLGFSRPVRNDAEIMQLARRGDIRGMQGIFQHGKGSVSDVTVDGTTLLHVCLPFNTSRPLIVPFLIDLQRVLVS